MASIVSFVCHENVTITRGLNGEKHPKGLPGLVFSSVSALPSPVDKSLAAPKMALRPEHLPEFQH
jgi:hypothetical protein